MADIDMNIESILTSIKIPLNITEEATAFDAELIMHINTTFDIFYQLGSIPKIYHITSAADKWEDANIVPNADAMVRSQMFLRVKMLFDPPSTTHVTEATNAMIAELDWRSMIAAETE